MELFAESPVLFGLGQIRMGGQESVYIHRFAVLEVGKPSVMEKVSVIDAGGHHVGLALGCAAESDTGNALLDGLKFASGRVAAFRKKAERHLVGQHLVYLIKGLVVVCNGPQAVPLPGQGKDAQEAERLFGRGFPENVGPGTKDRGLPAGLQHHQRIQQRVGVVGGNDDGSRIRKFSLGFENSVALPGAEVYIGPEQAVEAVMFPNLRHFSC